MKVSQRLHNDTYAPGIPTYGIPGKTGDKGEPGTGMFFCDYNLPSQINQLAQKITSRKLPLQNKEVVLDRKYINGDTFVTRNGKVYKLKNIELLSKNYANGALGNGEQYLDVIGVFDTERSIFNNDNNSLKTSYLVISDSSASYNNNPSTALLTLNRKNNVNGSTSFINFNSLYGPLPRMNLEIKYDNTLSAFVFQSDYPIVFEANTYVKQNAIKPLYGYSPIVTNENTITKFYGIAQKVIYNLDASIYSYTKKDSSTVYYGCLYTVDMVEKNDGILNNYLVDSSTLIVHFQNNQTQDFQVYRESELTYYFREDYNYVVINDVINEVYSHYLPTIQVSLISNVEVYLKKGHTHLVGYKINL